MTIQLPSTLDEEGADGLHDLWAQRLRDPDETLARAERLRDDAIAVGDDLAAGRALTLMGSCLTLQNDFAAALRAVLEGLKLLEGAPALDRARALAEAGHIETTIGRLPEGVELLFAALDLFREIDDPGGQASTLNRIGVAFYGHEDLDQALDAYERCLDLLSDEESPLQYAGVLNNLAKIRTARGDATAALYQLDLARRAFEDAGEGRGVAMTHHNAAVAHLALGDPDRARTLLEDAIDLYEAVGHVHGACESRSRLGRLLADHGALDAAAAMLRRAHDDAEARGLDHECVRAAEGLADVREQQGDLTTALRWLRYVREVERRVFDAESDRRLRTLQVRFQLDRLEHDSVTDPLTRLLNRRGLDRLLERAVDRARGDGADLAVLLCDLDNFKQVNDRFSHSVGDEVLRAVGQILQAAVRPTDLCARYGGEEFVVVLPGCDAAQGRRTGAALAAHIRDHDWSRLVDGLAVTASIGVASIADADDTAQLLTAADRAMYDAKRGGRDAVR